MSEPLESALTNILNSKPVTQDEALALAEASMEDLPELMSAARKVRDTFRGDVVSFCAIINAKSGRCGEDCRFCAQSVRYNTGVKSYPLIPEEQILEGAEKSAEDGASFFCIVTSGRRATTKEIEKICDYLKKMKEAGKVRPCASLGTLEKKDFVQLKKSGLVRYHHNIETARSYYASICTTHSYDQRVETVLAAKQAGLQVCCGGIFGMGEDMEQRVEMALALRELAFDSIPMNFLNPIAGTPMSGQDPLSKDEALKTVALFRLINPTVEIRACAGREDCLGEDQGMLFDAGMDGLLTGDYLTTKGTSPDKDRETVTARGLRLSN